MSEKVKKRRKNKQNTEENSSEDTNMKKPKDKPSKKRKPQDHHNEVTEKKSVKFSEETIDNEVEGNPSRKKKRNEQPEELAPLSEELEAEINRPENIKNVASKRQQKREKYEKLKANIKLQSETQMQQRALNYLSRWKHNRQEWKFEKIRQIWIQTNMFDSARVPDEFWETTIQYFGGSKGQIRQTLIKECMKIVDAADKSGDEENETSEIEETKFKRARELLQHLQE